MIIGQKTGLMFVLKNYGMQMNQIFCFYHTKKLSVFLIEISIIRKWCNICIYFSVNYKCMSLHDEK